MDTNLIVFNNAYYMFRSVRPSSCMYAHGLKQSKTALYITTYFNKFSSF